MHRLMQSALANLQRFLMGLNRQWRVALRPIIDDYIGLSLLFHRFLHQIKVSRHVTPRRRHAFRGMFPQSVG